MIQENVSLKSYNTFGVEALARFFTEVNSEEELIKVLQNDKIKNVPILFLGGGSNIFFTRNFDGIVIKLNIKGIEEKYIDEEKVLVTAKAGENWHHFVQFCIDKNYGGLENLSLIPGNVGTCPIQNIGAYGVEIKDYFKSCKALNLRNLNIENLINKDCHFGYRDSIFKREAKGKYAILEVSFLLSRNNHSLKTEYGDIQSELERMNVRNPTIQDVSKAVIRIRESKLPDPKIIGNAGSFFKNPTISRKDFEILENKFTDIRGFENENGIKVPAGWLIEKAGWKGKQIGNIATHEFQSLVIVNKTGLATGQEIFDFSQKIIDSVEEKFGITLEREVNVI